MWTKRKIWKEKKEKKSNQQMDHSLSRNKFKWNCKTILLVLPYLSRKFQEYHLPKFVMVTIATLAKMQNTSICHHPFLFPKCIQNYSKSEHLGYGELLHFTSFPSIPCSYFSEIYNCSKYLKYNLFHYRHYIAFNQNANKTFLKLRTNTVVSS